MIYCLFSTFSLHSDGILLEPDTTLAYVFYFSFPMSSFDLKQASKLLANLDQSKATDPRLKRLTFNTSLVCQNFFENVGLNIQGFTCSQGCYVLPTAVGVPREDIMSLMMQMCWVVFVLTDPADQLQPIYVSAKIYTIDPRVDDTYVQKFIAEFIVRKDRLPWLFTPQPVFSIYQIG